VLLIYLLWLMTLPDVNFAGKLFAQAGNSGCFGMSLDLC